MPVPIIAGAAAAVAARLAAKKAAQELAKKAAKAATAKTAQIAKNSVKVKPAAKPVGNPPNNTKAWESVLSSASRGGVGRTMGKLKDSRAANSKNPTADSARAANTSRPKVNSSNSVKVKPTAKQPVVKRVARKTAPKTDLSNRGAKPTTRERINRARDLQWNKAEKSYEASNEISMTGLKSTNQGRVAARGAGKKNMRKRDAIRSEANKNLPIQINSARPFTSPSSGNMFRGTDILKANNTRALKAANRTRSGKSAKKK